MEEQTDTQQAFFNLIKKKTPSNISYIEEVANVLKISYDRAYRRVKGKKQLTLSELKALSLHYNISIDTILFEEFQQNYVRFKKLIIKPDNNSFENWLKSIAHDLSLINEQKEKQIIYAAKDPPIWYHWNFPDIAAFKVFFWKKTLLQIPEYENKKFSLSDEDEQIYSIGRKILNLAVQIPSIELWNEDTFNILLRQIEYYWISGIFRDNSDIIKLCNSLEKWVGHIEKQAELGLKYIHNEETQGIGSSFKFYENEVVLNDNTIIVNTPDQNICYLTYNTLNLLTTTDPVFVNSIREYFNLLEKKSILISSCASKERKRFFNKFITAIKVFKKKVKTE